MTVNDIYNKITYEGNGSTTAWPFSFPAGNVGAIAVFISDQLGNFSQIHPSYYTVLLNPPIGTNPTSVGGIVNYPISGPGIDINHWITILRDLPAVQATSISNQSIIYPPIVEQEFDYLTMLDQEGEELRLRAFQVGPTDPNPAVVPPVAQRANQLAFFDSAGNLTAGQPPVSGAIISAAMQPVVAAATLDQARSLLGVAVPTLIVTSTYTVLQNNNRQVLDLTGSTYYTVTVGDAAGFSTTFWTILYNLDVRAKNISVAGWGTFLLYQNQWAWIVHNGNVGWLVVKPGRWVTGGANFYVNASLGSDSNDGLAVDAGGAFQTIQHAV